MKLEITQPGNIHTASWWKNFSRQVKINIGVNPEDLLMTVDNTVSYRRERDRMLAEWAAFFKKDEPYHLFFESDEDAMAFLLRWS